MKNVIMGKMGLRLCAMSVACLAAVYSRASVDIDPGHKHAWAENTGWGNAAPTLGGVTVHFDGDAGYLAGYAWGENIGWIKLGDGSGGPYQNDSATDWGVNLEASGNLSGRAWGENVGWITFASTHHQVIIDPATGRFDGHAWGENIGWVRFQGNAPAYGVRTQAFDTQPRGSPNWWLAHHGVEESHDEGDQVPAWEEYVADTDPTDPSSCFRIGSVSNPESTVVSFSPSSSRRCYTLQRQDALVSGTWINVPGQVDVPGTDGPDSLQDSTPGTRQIFYRMEVKVTP